MPFRSIATPEQLALLTQVVEDHCADVGIATGTISSEAVARSVMAQFERGVSSYDDLRAALAVRPEPVILEAPLVQQEASYA